MTLVEDFVASLERVKIYTASCEDLHRRCRWFLAALEENSYYMEPDESLRATQTLDGMLSKIIKRLDEWGHLTLLETFVRRAEIQFTLRSMSDDLRILASQLQLVTGPELHTSPAESAHLDIQDSVEMKGILRYLAGRPEELKVLAQGTFTPTDCQNFAKALQMADQDDPCNERAKLADAMWRLVTWTNMPLPLTDLTAEVQPCEDQTPLWQGDYTEVFNGKWGGHHVALTVSKTLNNSKGARKALEEGIAVWSKLRHNHLQHVWGSIRLGGDLYIVGPCMKHWNLELYLESGPNVDRFNLLMNLATGLEFLHKQSPPMMVGDITMSGVHISDKGKACFASYAIFPMILQMVDNGILSCTPANVRCFAPELLSANRAEITVQSDVYGFAILCYQILTGVVIHLDVPEDKVVAFIREGHPPERPETTEALLWLSDDLWALLEKCWFLEPMNRPSMASVVGTLRLLDRARRDGSITITKTVTSAIQNTNEFKSSVANKEPNSVKHAHEPHVQYTASGGIISATLSGLVRLMLNSATTGLSSVPSNTFFFMFRAFTTPEILLDTVEVQYHDHCSRAVSVEARIATSFDLLNFLETWLRNYWSYSPTKLLAEQLKNLVGAFSTPPTLVERVKGFIEMVDEWVELSTSTSSSLTLTPAASFQFDLGGMSPRSIAGALACIQSELFENISPPDFVQWGLNISCRAGRNNISVFIERHNQISHWVTKSILEAIDLRRRVEIVEFFINTSSECIALGDYSSVAAIVAGLRRPFVKKLIVTWKCISERTQRALQSMESIFDPTRNFLAYRKAVTARDEPWIPHLGINLRDVKLLFALASPPISSEKRDGLVPFGQYQNLYRHLIGIISKPQRDETYQKIYQTETSASLDHTLQHVVLNESSVRELEQRSAEIVASERRLPPRKMPMRRTFFGHEPRRSPTESGSRAQSPTGVDVSDSDHSQTKRRHLPLRVKDLSRDVVKLEEHSITGGGFCDVYLGEARFSNKVERVAMKMLRVGGAEQKVKKSFYREVETWIRVRHTFVLPFYGVSEQNGRLYMISPWAEHGNALQYLEVHPNANRRKLLWQTSDALRYLHSGTDSPRIVHGDIKAENILISDTGDAMLADFGLARLVDTIAAMTETSTNFGGSARFMAPELLIPEASDSDRECMRTTSSDVWAFGCLMLQIFTGQRPFNHLPMDPQVLLAIVHGEKPSPRPPSHEAVRRGFDDDLWELALKCWEYEPLNRPGMRVASTQLRDSRYRLQTADLI